jgi:hypothetical protein
MPDEFFRKLKLLFLPCRENNCKPKILESRFLYYYAVLLLIFKVSTVFLVVYLPKTPFFADITKTSLIQLANQDRQNQGIASLSTSTKLDEAAMLKAQDMLAEGYFSHSSPQGTTPWHWFDAVGYNYEFAGENLAIGFLDSNEVNQAWLDSPSHRKNILNQNYTEIGLAVLSGEFQGGQTTIVVQLFGNPQNQSQVAGVSNANNPPEATPNNIQQTATSIVQQAAPAIAVSSGTQGTGTVPKEVLSAFQSRETKKSFIESVLKFLASDSYDVFQKIAYGSLFLIIFLFLITVIFDIFVYRAYEIQHKDVLAKSLLLFIILILLILVDKTAILNVIPRNVGIY